MDYCNRVFPALFEDPLEKMAITRICNPVMDGSHHATYRSTEGESVVGTAAPLSTTMDSGTLPSHLCQRDVTLEALSIDEKLRPKEDEMLPLYKDSRRRMVFFGILTAWFFVSIRLYVDLDLHTNFSSFLRKVLMTR